MGSIYFKRGELHLAIADMGYVIADVAAAKVDAHTLHQTFDICQGNNLERIDNLLTLAFTEVSQALSPITLPIPESRLSKRGGEIPLLLKFKDGCVSTPRLLRIREAVREFLIARALAGWLSVTLPTAAATWDERASLLLPTLAHSLAGQVVLRRESSPF